MIFINTRVFNTNKPDYKKKADDNVRKLKEVMEKLVVSTPEPTATTTTGVDKTKRNKEFSLI